MSRKKYYMEPGGAEYVYRFEHWTDVAYDNGGPIVVELCKREIGGEPWCTQFSEFIDTSDVCGKQCNHYEPRNGKSGCCTQCVQGFIGTGQLYTVTEYGSVRRKQADDDCH